jgi:NDP-sugar pyrophosphorylase family protein
MVVLSADNTAGPLALAREILGKDDTPFFVLNSDVTCSYPFEQFRYVPSSDNCNARGVSRERGFEWLGVPGIGRGDCHVIRTPLAESANTFFPHLQRITTSLKATSFREAIKLTRSDFHIAHGCEGSIMVTKVAEPSAYGVVVTKPNSTVIDRFVEKPVQFVGNRINAGIYMFNPSVLDRIEVCLSSTVSHPWRENARERAVALANLCVGRGWKDAELMQKPRPTSIEKEIFPAIAADQQLHSYDLAGFWMDVGQPKDYITGMSIMPQHPSELRS